MSLTTLCGLFGKTRQSYYVHQNEVTQAALNEEMIVKWVIQQREEIGRVGGKKLFHKFQLSAEMEGIKMGRDAFLTLLQVHDLVLRSKRKYTITTHSRHWLRKYPDLIKGLIVNRPEQLWVSDITYLRTQNGFCYLSLNLNKLIKGRDYSKKEGK